MVTNFSSLQLQDSVQARKSTQQCRYILSHLPVADYPTTIPIPGETILLLDMLHSLPVTAENIKHWTSHDPVLSRVRDMILQG